MVSSREGLRGAIAAARRQVEVRRVREKKNSGRIP